MEKIEERTEDLYYYVYMVIREYPVTGERGKRAKKILCI